MAEVTQTTPTTTFDAFRAKVLGFADLAKGWDSHGSNPPSELAIQGAIELLNGLEAIGVEPDWVVPTSDDSILIQYQYGEATWKWELENDGDVGVMERPAVGDPCFFDLKVAEVRSFLDQQINGGK